MNDIAWTWLLIRASGVTAWALLTAVVFWGLFLRTRLLGTKSPPVALLHMHRWLGSLALVILAVHLGALLIDPVVGFSVSQILIPGTDARAEWSIALLIASSATLTFLLLARGFVPAPTRKRSPTPKPPETTRQSGRVSSLN